MPTPWYLVTCKTFMNKFPQLCTNILAMVRGVTKGKRSAGRWALLFRGKNPICNVIGPSLSTYPHEPNSGQSTSPWYLEMVHLVHNFRIHENRSNISIYNWIMNSCNKNRSTNSPIILVVKMGQCFQEECDSFGQ